MVPALMALLLAPAPAPADAAAVRRDDPPIRVWLNQDNYFFPGDRARVRVETTEDGYVVVLRADAEGRVRVLFPLDPGDDAFVRGGKKIEIRGRGDREAFSIDEREGSGVVLAARSAAPLKLDEFVRGDHWDYRTLAAREAGADKEQMLLELVQRMAPDGHFDYDVVSYTVASSHAYYDRYRPYRTYIGVNIGWGWPYRRGYFSSCFDPFWYDPFFCSAFYDPYFYGYNPFFYDPFFYGPRYYSPYIYVYRPSRFYRAGVFVTRPRYGGGLFIDRLGRGGGALTFKDRFSAPPTTMGIGPRLRVPQGTLLERAPVRVVPVSAAAPTRVPIRDRGLDDFRSTPVVRDRGAAPERRGGGGEVRPQDRRDAGRGGWDRPAPERREGGSVRGRDGGSSGGGGAVRRSGGGGGGSGGGGRSAGAARPSGSRGSAPSNGGGRRRP